MGHGLLSLAGKIFPLWGNQTFGLLRGEHVELPRPSFIHTLLEKRSSLNYCFAFVNKGG